MADYGNGTTESLGASDTTPEGRTLRAMDGRRAWFATVLLLLPGAALAGSPSDVELRAQYCIGVIREELSAYAEDAKNAHKVFSDPEINAFYSQAQTHARDRLKRLTDYLMPRTGGLDPQAMMIARAQGIKDARRSLNEVPKCLDECLREHPNRAAICDSQCGTQELERHLRQCRELTWLPY